MNYNSCMFFILNMGCCAFKNPQVVHTQIKQGNLDTQEEQLIQLKRLGLYKKAKCAPVLQLKNNTLFQRRKVEMHNGSHLDLKETHSSKIIQSSEEN